MTILTNLEPEIAYRRSRVGDALEGGEGLPGVGDAEGTENSPGRKLHLHHVLQCQDGGYGQEEEDEGGGGRTHACFLIAGITLHIEKQPVPSMPRG